MNASANHLILNHISRGLSTIESCKLFYIYQTVVIQCMLTSLEMILATRGKITLTEIIVSFASDIPSRVHYVVYAMYDGSICAAVGLGLVILAEAIAHIMFSIRATEFSQLDKYCRPLHLPSFVRYTR
jgi:hypothetical protein